MRLIKVYGKSFYTLDQYQRTNLRFQDRVLYFKNFLLTHLIFDSLESTFRAGLKSEQTVTKFINNLVEVAEREKDRATYSFLQWFVSEQIEEETLFETILQKFEVVGRDKLAVYQIDQSLASIRSEIMTKGDDQQQPSAN